MTLGSRIAALRAAQGLSQSELAERLEVSRQSVSKWETDASVPELDKLTRLARIFDVTLDELVTGDEPGPEVSGEALPAPAPAPNTTWQPLRSIVGSALLLFGALMALIFSLRGNELMVVWTIVFPFLGCGMICLLFKTLLPLWCGWFVCLCFLFSNLVPIPVWPIYGTLLMPVILSLITGWCLRNRLLCSAERRWVFLGSWLAGPVALWTLLRIGIHFYGTVIMALSQSENNRRQLFGQIMLNLATLLFFVLVSTALAALFYGLGRLRRKLAKKEA